MCAVLSPRPGILEEYATTGRYQGMLEHEKFCSSAAIATALTVSGGTDQTNFDDDGAKLPLYQSNERYTCINSDNLYAVPKVDLHETEWIESDSIETEISRFVAGSSTTARNHLRRCRTSTSSGYSSHSSPLSAGSYSCYASALYGQSCFRNVPLTTKNLFDGGGLAVIHENEAIPRPIWPSAFPSPRELYLNDESPDYDVLYTCWGCGCVYTSSYCDRECEKSANTSAHEVLLELSRTLNSVIDGDSMSPEEILQNISHKVAQGIGMKGVYEYVYNNSSFLPNKKTLVNEKSSYLLNSNRNSSSKVNPVNSKLYTNTRHFYIYNPAWYTCLCSCEHSHRFLSPLKNDEQVVTINEPNNEESPTTTETLVEDYYQGTNPWLALQNKGVSELHMCECLNHSTYHVKSTQSIYENHRERTDTKKTININEGTKHNRGKIVSSEPKYAVQLESGYGDSFNEDIVFSSKKNSWEYRMQGFVGDLDFTLDVSRAERLGRIIAKAKRKRQWCRALTAVFGLVFFVLSVVIVSLSVTRGRKVFGSI